MDRSKKDSVISQESRLSDKSRVKTILIVSQSNSKDLVKINLKIQSDNSRIHSDQTLFKVMKDLF